MKQPLHDAPARRDMQPASPGLPRGCPIVCLSHLRWNFVYQRPQHLMERFARDNPVFYVEEPIADDDRPARLELHSVARNVTVVVPRLPAADCIAGHRGGETTVRGLLAQLLVEHPAPDGLGPIVWLYTPMALGQARDLEARLVVYDCMDQLANFLHAPKTLRAREQALMGRADLVFTGGCSLFDSRRKLHPRTYLFPSSVDTAHFSRAYAATDDPADMQGMPRPRIGFFGVIDERLDLDLLRAAANARPEWQWVIVGPVVKIDESSLPRLPNLHYLGSKPYELLPGYLGRWDVAMMPFAINASTRFISPTKTPEYLAGGCPVVSTPVTDVVRAYGTCEAVHIALGADEFVAQIGRALRMPARGATIRAAAERALSGLSWDRTQASMAELMHRRMQTRSAVGTRTTAGGQSQTVA